MHQNCRANSLRHLLLLSPREVYCSSSWYWEVLPPLLTLVPQPQMTFYQSRKVHNFHQSQGHAARSNFTWCLCFFHHLPSLSLYFLYLPFDYLEFVSKSKMHFRPLIWLIKDMSLKWNLRHSFHVLFNECLIMILWSIRIPFHSNAILDLRVCLKALLITILTWKMGTMTKCSFLCLFIKQVITAMELNCYPQIWCKNWKWQTNGSLPVNQT